MLAAHEQRFLYAYVRYTWTVLTKQPTEVFTHYSHPHITETGLFTNQYTFRHPHACSQAYHWHACHGHHMHSQVHSCTLGLQIFIFMCIFTRSCIQVIKSHTKITTILSSAQRHDSNIYIDIDMYMYVYIDMYLCICMGITYTYISPRPKAHTSPCAPSPSSHLS